MPGLDVRLVSRGERAEWGARVSEMERGITYPLGDDRFEIDHGADYFAFFERLGEPEILVAAEGDRLLAVAVFVLRRVSRVPSEAPRPVWYACDLKIAPGHRGRGVLSALLEAAGSMLSPRCSRAYGISMDPAEGARNRVVTAVMRLAPVPVRSAGTLVFATLDFDGMTDLEPRLREERGALSYLSLAGKKDIVLRSTGRPMPLFHVQSGAHAEEGLRGPQPGCAHMFCFPAGDPVEALLPPEARPTATILRHGLDDQDWRFVLTSDI